MTHKHGEQAGSVTYEGMNVGVNMTKTVFHVQVTIIHPDIYEFIRLKSKYEMFSSHLFQFP